MSDTINSSQRARLYSEMLIEAQRLGDDRLLSMAKNRLGETHRRFVIQGCEHKVIPFPGYSLEAACQVPKSQSLWSILWQSAMIPAVMATILFAFIQASLYLYNGPMPLGWFITK